MKPPKHPEFTKYPSVAHREQKVLKLPLPLPFSVPFRGPPWSNKGIRLYPTHINARPPVTRKFQPKPTLKSQSEGPPK